MLPALLKLRIATSMMASWSASTSPVPVPAQTVAVLVAGHMVEPLDVTLYDENMHVTSEVAIERDGSTDDETAVELKRLFRCRRTGRERAVAKKTLAMLADVSEHYDGRKIEFVSAVRLGSDEGWESPHRAGRAIDFRIRGVSLTMIRDYVWKKYADVGVGWYPSEQFLHIDTRPGLHDTAWTFSKGVNFYHPWWAELARMPPKPVVVPKLRTGV